MPIFENRESAYEAKFAIDEETKFKARVRCSGLAGHWAARKLGLAGSDADDYVKNLVAAVIETSEPDDLFKRIRMDFKLNRVAQSDHQIHRVLDEFMTRAIADVRGGE